RPGSLRFRQMQEVGPGFSSADPEYAYANRGCGAMIIATSALIPVWEVTVRPLAGLLFASVLVSFVPVVARADLGKLDARTRFAYEQLRSGATAQSLRDRGLAVAAEGTMEVFVRGAA